MQKLRHKFILIAMLALATTMILVTGAINLVNWMNVRAEIGETVSFLAESDGTVSAERKKEWAGRNRHRENVLTQAVYFVGRTEPDGSVQIVNQGRAETPGRDTAESLVRRAAASGRESGFLDDYCYRRLSSRGDGTSWVFLNCEQYLTATRNLLWFSAVICAAGILLALLMVSLLSKKAIRPFLRNEQKQRQFITDASHELKAPLAVISANMDVLALTDPDNQWINGTKNQVASMRRLVEDMVCLSRADEAARPDKTEIIDLKDLLPEVAEPFQAMAEFQGKAFRCEAKENLPVSGEQASIRQIVSILCDNAVKYTPEGGEILLRARREGKHAVIETENPPAKALSEEDCARLFDRFYRSDEARDREKRTGYGIGLSIAKAVVTRSGGTVKACMTPANTLLIHLSLPLSADHRG